MAQRISILTPLAYIFVMVTSIIVFSVVYRRRKVLQLSNLKPVYDISFARDNYFYVKDLYDQQKEEKKLPIDKRVPLSVVHSALTRWAENDIRQIIKMKQNKEILTQMHQRGFIADSTYTKFVTSEKALELEVQDIVAEAESIQEGLGQQLFALVTDISQSDGLRVRMQNAQKLKAEYQERLDKVRAKAIAELENES